MIEPTLLFRGPDLVVVNKPSGWLVHSAGTDASDLLSWLATSEAILDMAPAHRIDGNTSGLVLFAKGPRLKALTTAFSEGGVEKRYQALVFGATRAKGRIARKLDDGRRKSKLSAVTRYRTMAHYRRCSLLDVKPETGRKHQIRRHLQGIGHAVVGDTRYPPRGKKTVPAFPGRLWLHAASVALPSGQNFEAPLPPELQAHLDTLKGLETATPSTP